MRDFCKSEGFCSIGFRGGNPLGGSLRVEPSESSFIVTDKHDDGCGGDDAVTDPAIDVGNLPEYHIAKECGEKDL